MGRRAHVTLLLLLLPLLAVPSASAARSLIEVELDDGSVVPVPAPAAPAPDEVPAAGAEGGAGGETDELGAWQASEAAPAASSGIAGHISQTLAGVRKSHDDHVVPAVSKLHAKGKEMAMATHSAVHAHVAKYVHAHYSLFVASVITYTLLIFPPLATLSCLLRVNAVLSLQKVLLFCNVWASLYCATLFLIAVLGHGEPMEALHHDSLGNYVLLQLVQALLYTAYVGLNFMQVYVLSFANAPNQYQVAIGNTVLGLIVALHYYVIVWRPAMLGHPPSMSWRIYGLYTIIFVSFTLSTRLVRDKRPVLQQDLQDLLLGQNRKD